MSSRELIDGLTKEILIKNACTGTQLPEELLKTMSKSYNEVYAVKATTYGFNDKNKTPLGYWYVNDKIYMVKEEAQMMVKKCQEYTENFGEIYKPSLNPYGQEMSNKFYLLDKISYIGFNLSAINLDQPDLYSVRTSKIFELDKDKKEEERKNYEKIIISSRDKVNKLIKNYNDNIIKNFKKKKQKMDFEQKRRLLKDELTTEEMAYVISFLRYHPDIKFPYYSVDLHADYNLEEFKIYK